MWCSEIYDGDLTSVGPYYAQIQSGGDRGSGPPPPEKSKETEQNRHTDQDPLKNLKATKPAMLGHH